ncbi:MAG: hypothetical protein ACXVC6_13835 [Bacteroidia bacterium]
MLLVSVYIVLFIILIYTLPFFKENYIHRGALTGVFLIKVAAGLFLTWVYTKYYTDRQAADIFKYFDDSKVMYSAFANHRYGDYIKMLTGIANDSPYFDQTYYDVMLNWYRAYDFNYNDNHTIIRFNGLVMIFSQGNYNVHTVFMCFTGLFGLTALYKSFANYFAGKEKILFAALFLIPSVIFWSSGVLKEGILMFAMGVLFYTFMNALIAKKNILRNIILMLISIFLITINKNYLLYALVPALFCYYIVYRFKIKQVFIFFGLVYLAGTAAILIAMPDMLNELSLKQRDFIAVAKGGTYLKNNQYKIRIAPDKKEYLDTITPKIFHIKPGSTYFCWKEESPSDTIFVTNSSDTARYYLLWDYPEAGSTIKVEKLEPTVASFIKTAPFALYNSLCKPGLFSSKSLFEKMAALENIITIIFLFTCIWFRKREFDKNLLALCLFFSLTLLLLIGYTTPIAGAIMRYKVPLMPFLFMSGIVILDEKRLKFFSKKSGS